MLSSVNKNYLVLVDESSKEKVKLKSGVDLFRSNSYGTDFDRMPYWGEIYTSFDGAKRKSGEEVGFFHMVLRKKKRISGKTFYSATEDDIICTLPDTKARTIWIGIEHTIEKYESQFIEDKINEQRVSVISSESSVADIGDIIHIPRNADYIFERLDKKDYFCRETRVIYNETKDTLHNDFVLVEPLDEEGDYEMTKFGLYLPKKELADQQKGVVFKSQSEDIKKGDIVFYKKSSNTAVELDKKYYGVKVNEIKIKL